MHNEQTDQSLPLSATVARKVAIGAGAPAYTSGVHLWNGASDNLKPTANTINARPITHSWLTKYSKQFAWFRNET